jgi:hypothetical protein
MSYYTRCLSCGGPLLSEAVVVVEFKDQEDIPVALLQPRSEFATITRSCAVLCEWCDWSGTVADLDLEDEEPV